MYASVGHASSPSGTAAAGRQGQDGVHDTVGQRLRQIRHNRGWSQHRLIYAMRQVARQQRGQELPSDESLKAMVSRWENSRRRPSEFNLRLLCSALSVSPADVVPAVDRRARMT
jgi:transcriptional regulator with XRE-family HTH domain